MCRARESLMHMLREMDDWMTNFVAAAVPSDDTSETKDESALPESTAKL